MTPGHATADMLADYAAGTLSDGVSLLVAGHLTYCPACRAKVARLESLCGALLTEALPAASPPPSIDTVLDRLDRIDLLEPIFPPRKLCAFSSMLPAPLRNWAHAYIANSPWTPVMPGLSEMVLPGFQDAEVKIVRADPGFHMPHHTHTGDEVALMMQGRIRDGDTVFRAGDLAITGEGHEHEPVVLEGEFCLCLLASTGSFEITPAPAG